MARERRRRGAGDAQRGAERGARGRRERGAGAGPGRAWALLALALGAAGLAYGLYGRWRLGRRVVTPHPAPRVLPAGSSGPRAAPERFWGSYRPHVYFGMRPRSARPPVAGLMWLRQAAEARLRHTCEQSDGLPGYGWLLHDGLRFGAQEIRDRGLTLRTEFVKRPGGEHGGDWSWRVTARPESPGNQTSLVSLLFYVATNGQGTLQPHVENTRLVSVTGTSEELGHFNITFHKPTTDTGEALSYASYNHLDARSPGLHRLTDVVKSSLSNRFVYAAPGGPKRRYFAVDTYRALPGEPCLT